MPSMCAGCDGKPCAFGSRCLPRARTCLLCTPDRLRSAFDTHTGKIGVAKSIGQLIDHHKVAEALGRLRRDEQLAILLGEGKYCRGDGVLPCEMNTTHVGLPAPRWRDCSFCVLCCPKHLFLELLVLDGAKKEYYERNIDECMAEMDAMAARFRDLVRNLVPEEIDKDHKSCAKIMTPLFIKYFERKNIGIAGHVVVEQGEIAESGASGGDDKIDATDHFDGRPSDGGCPQASASDLPVLRTIAHAAVWNCSLASKEAALELLRQISRSRKLVQAMSSLRRSDWTSYADAWEFTALAVAPPDLARRLRLLCDKTQADEASRERKKSGHAEPPYRRCRWVSKKNRAYDGRCVKAGFRCHHCRKAFFWDKSRTNHEASCARRVGESTLFRAKRKFQQPGSGPKNLRQV